MESNSLEPRESLGSSEEPIETNSIPASDLTNDAIIVDAKLVSIAPNLERSHWLHPSSIFFDILGSIWQLMFAGVLAFAFSGSNNRFALLTAFVIVCFTAIGAVLRYATLRYAIVNGELRIDEGLVFRRHRVIPATRIQNIDLLQNPIHHWLRVAEVRIETAGGSEPEAKLRVLAIHDVTKLRSAILDLSRGATYTADSRRAIVSQPARDALSADKLTGDTASASDPQAIPARDRSVDADAEWSMDNATISHSLDERLDGEAILAISLRQLVIVGLISNRGFIVIPFVLGIMYETGFYRRLDMGRLFDSLPADLSTMQTILATVAGSLVVLAFMRLFSVGWYVLRFYGYRLQRQGTDLRVTCGLFTKVSATVPQRRIQFISVHQTLLGRWFGLCSVRLETAGGGGTANNEDAAETVARRWFVPVTANNDVQRLLAYLRPNLTYEPDLLDWIPAAPRTASRLIRLAVLQSIAAACIGLLYSRPWGALLGLVVLPVSMYLALRYARSLKYARTPLWMVYRSGILTRKTSITFYDKVQSIAVTQSPFDRRWQMATLIVDTAGAGPADHRIQVKYLPEAIALEQLDQIAESTANSALTLS